MVFFNIFSFFSQEPPQKAPHRGAKGLPSLSRLRIDNNGGQEKRHTMCREKNVFAPAVTFAERRFESFVFSFFYIIILASSIFDTIHLLCFFVISLNEKILFTFKRQ